ncbi:MAG: amidohydrolase family protein [Maritimibacter sp.]|nr:amidohydrolase family protein [Maritimibacter sp.]
MTKHRNLPFHPAPSKPALQLPPGACDSHCHVFGPAEKFPFSAASSYLPVDAPAEVLAQRHAFLGFDRAVIVQASCHGTDNRAMLDALAKVGDSRRGVAIVDADIADDALHAFDLAGVRGVRFNLVQRLGARQSPETYSAITARIAPLGWHVVLHLDAEDIASVTPFLKSMPVPIVIDHMARIPAGDGIAGAHFAAVARLLEDDKFWIKLSGSERLSASGPPYDDMLPLARALYAAAPDRALWGTDWPHPNMDHITDDGLLVDRLAQIAPDEVALTRLLVDNPHRLYWQDGGPHG